MIKLHSEPWMQTFTGKKVYLSNISPDDISIEDIAHSLSLICRYNGHCSKFYSVAEHSYWASMIVPEEDAKWALLHDAAEAYVGDMIRPLKYMAGMEAFLEVEQKVHEAVAVKFGLPLEMPESIHMADDATLLAEKRDIIPVNLDWGFPDGMPIMAQEIKCWLPGIAEQMFLGRYNELFNL